MSAEQSSVSVLRPLPHGDTHADAAGETLQPIGETGTSGESLPITTAELANLLAHGHWGDASLESAPSTIDMNAYDGHVALALDTGVLPAIDSTLDMLTSSHHLFDVPALDVPSDPGDASSA